MPTGPTILVVDDEVELCAVLEKVLAKEGYHVLTANNGEQALSLLKKKAIQLLLLDLKMPEIDGLEVLKQIRELGKQEPPAVIILTAHGSLSSAREAMALGAVDYITKPFDLGVVKAMVKEALGGT